MGVRSNSGAPRRVSFTGSALLRLTGAIVVALALAVPAMASTASAATASSRKTVHECSTAKKGYRACMAIRVVSGTSGGGISPAATVSGLSPANLQSAYKLPSSTAGSGKTVALVDSNDDPNAESDLAVYRSNFGLPACTTANGCFKKVNQTGGTSYPTGDTGWGGEISLDLDMVSAACPNCHILLVEASSASDANLGTAVNEAVSAGAVAVSNSYGGDEASNETSEDTSYYKHPGVAITASSGDDAYGVEYPAASQYVTAVGGTSLTTASNSRGWNETAWNDAGSGCSKYEAKPTWQTDTGCTKRTVADVSAVADPNTGVAVYDTYGGASAGAAGWEVYGGTSASSPIIASVYAMATATPVGVYPSSYPYADRGALFDVTSGSNGSCSPTYLCTAGTGYDGPTGLGTPNGVGAFGPGAPTNDFSISASPTAGSVNAGSSTTATISTATISGSSQSVALTATGAPAGVTASLSPTSVTSGSSSTLTLSTTSAVATGSYPITVTGTAASGSHSTTYTLSVTGTAPANDFSISASPTSDSVTAGGSATNTIATATTAGSAQTVALTASGAPTGVTASLSPTSVTSGSSSTLTLSTTTAAAAGTYTITVKGTATSGSHTATVSLTVKAPAGCTSAGQKIANPGFESGSASWTATSGVIGAYNSSGEPAHSGSYDAWLDGYGTTHTDTLSQSLVIPAGCTNYTLSFYLHIDTSETTKTTKYDNLTVTLGSTTLATYSNLNAASGYSLKSFNVAGFAGQTVVLKFTGKEDVSLQTSFVIDDSALTVS